MGTVKFFDLLIYAIFVALLFFVMAISTANALPTTCAPDANSVRVLKLSRDIRAILLKVKPKKAPPAPKLALLLASYECSEGIPAELILRLIMLESGFEVFAVNPQTKDYGLMQINERTALAYGLNKNCLLHWECNIKAGIRVLTDLKRSHAKSYLCRYNVGTRQFDTELSNRCQKYLHKLAKVFPGPTDKLISGQKTN